jgi:hypothetical protein
MTKMLRRLGKLVQTVEKKSGTGGPSFTVTRGPYVAEVFTNSKSEVTKLGVSNKRPAILPPEAFFDLKTEANSTTVTEDDVGDEV